MGRVGLLLVSAIVGVGASPASAVTSLFAQYKQLPNSASTLQWVQTSPTTATQSNVATPGQGGYTLVNFNFSNNALASALGNVTAKFMLYSENDGAAQVATLFGNTIIGQKVHNGTFSFLTTAAATVNGISYAAGSNLLSGTFVGTIAGVQGANAAFSSNAVTTFVSDFVTFDPNSQYVFSLDLANISATGLAYAGGNTVLNTFTTPSTGNFSSDPAPIVNGVPEPEVWGLLVVGFGLIGVQVRRRRRLIGLAA